MHLYACKASLRQTARISCLLLLRQLQELSDKGISGNAQISEIRKEIAEVKNQRHLMATLKSQGILDAAYYTEHYSQLDRKLLSLQNQLHSLMGNDEDDAERISELSRNIDELIKLAAGGDTEQSMADIQKFSNEMTALREFIESEKAKQSAAEKDSRQLETVLDILEKEDFRLTEYDDVAVRHLIEYIKVIDKNTLLICFKGRFEVRKELSIGNLDTYTAL